MDEIRVDSVKAYLDKVNEITTQKPGKYIFRGQDKNQDGERFLPLDCGAARRIKKYLERQPTNEDLRKYHQKLIYYAKQRRYNIKDGSNLSDMEIIADLQHFGSATMLIDFTKNALVALYFAAIDNQNEDGAVFVMNQEEDIFENGFDAIKENDNISNTVILWSKLLGENPEKLFYWEPSSLNQRIPSQHSIFVFGQPEIRSNFTKFVIEAHRTDRYNDKKGKKAIVEELEKVFDINSVTLFNDLPGFAWSNRFTAKIDNDFLEFKSRDQEIFQKEQTEKQLDEYNKIDLRDNDKYGYLEKAKLYYNLTNYNLAIKYLTKVIEIDPKFALAYNNRGSAKANLDRHEDAIKDFDNAIILDPNFALAYNNRGNSKVNLGRNKNAIKDFDRAIEIDPKYALAYNNRGNANANLERYGDALIDYDNALEINPKFAMAYCNRGAAKDDMGCHKDAIVDYDKAIAIEPKYAEAYFNRGNSKAKLGVFEGAREDFCKARELAIEENNKKVLGFLEKCLNEDNTLKEEWKEFIKKTFLKSS